MSIGLGLIAVVLLVLLNGFFVATEFALVKVRPTRLDELARRGSQLARQARRLTHHLDEYLSATQLGITVASLGLGWIGEPAFARILDPLVQRFGLSEATVETIGATLAFLAITFLHIVFGELAPKSVAIQRAEATSIAVALPMRAFYVLFYPAIWALNGLARLALHLVGLRPAGEHQLAHSEEELRLIVASMRGPPGPARERLDMVERTLRLPSRRARDLMVPRRDIAFIRIDDTPEKRREWMRTHRHARYPVVDHPARACLPSRVGAGRGSAARIPPPSADGHRGGRVRWDRWPGYPGGRRGSDLWRAPRRA
ncbi:MAG: HlyC/CorC family transporter [Chloroflexi bacterium]|nr:MAG: HlyC/CorC family transporter [Chloroflexota bacterium]